MDESVFFQSALKYKIDCFLDKTHRGSHFQPFRIRDQLYHFHPKRAQCYHLYIRLILEYLAQSLQTIYFVLGIRFAELYEFI